MNDPNNNLEAIAQRVTGAEAISLDNTDDVMVDCPVQPLGMANGFYSFLSPEGELRKLSARDLTYNNIVSVFAGDASWLIEKFSEIDGKGRRRNDFNVKIAAAVLMRACHMRGFFSPEETPLRKHGVWRHGGKAVLHAGDAFFYDGHWHRAGQKLGEAVYVACATTERPNFDSPLDTFETRRLRQYMNGWSFDEPGDADLLFGWLGAALLGGFPNWRVHAFIIGERGSGKSTLGEYLTDCLGPQAESKNNFSEAGVRQSLQDEARAIYLDEAGIDSEAQKKRMDEAIRLFRQMSGGQGARITRGSAGGTANNTTVTGCVLMTAVHPPRLDNQDRSRILEISLKIPAQTETSKADIESFRAEAQRSSRGLRARALMRIDHFLAAFRLFNKILIAYGCDGRQSDMFATLLAGRSILVDEKVPTREAATEFVATFATRLRMIFIEDSEQSDGQKCLNHLYDYIPDVYRGSQRITVGQIIAAHMAGNSEDITLATYGLRMQRRLDADPYSMLVANCHGNLERIYATTPWAGSGWNKSLIRLPGVVKSNGTIRVGGRAVRGVWVPYDLLPKSVNPNAEPIDDPPRSPLITNKFAIF